MPIMRYWETWLHPTLLPHAEGDIFAFSRTVDMLTGSPPSGHIVTATRSTGNRRIRDCGFPPQRGMPTPHTHVRMAGRGLARTPLSDAEVPKLARA